MKKIKLITILVLLSMNVQLFASSGSEREAKKLLDILNMENMLDQSINQMLNLQLRQNSQLEPYKGVMLKFFNKYMSYDSIENDLIKIYAEAFTENELKDINRFYETSTGKKTIKLMPTLMLKGSQVGTSRVQNHLQELRQMIDEERKRIENLKKAK